MNFQIPGIKAMKNLIWVTKYWQTSFLHCYMSIRISFQFLLSVHRSLANPVSLFKANELQSNSAGILLIKISRQQEGIKTNLHTQNQSIAGRNKDQSAHSSYCNASIVCIAVIASVSARWRCNIYSVIAVYREGNAGCCFVKIGNTVLG